MIKNFIYIFFLVVSFFTTSIVSATTRSIPIENKLKEQGVQFDLGAIVSAGISVAISIAALALFAYFILAGYKWLSAGGDASKVEEARSTMTNALIGLAIVACIYAIAGIIFNFFGVGIDISDGNSGGGTNETTTNTGPSSQDPIDCSGGDCTGACTSCNGICNPSTGLCLTQ